MCHLPARIAREQSGFTIIEVLMSAVLVAMIATGVFAGFDAATTASGQNRSRTVAAGLAQSDQERIRSMTPDQLADLNETRSPVVNGKTYTVVSTAVWTTDPSGTASCAGMGQEAGYQKITSTVTWPDRGPLKPVVEDSLRAVPNGGYRDSRGSLAVKVTGANGTTGVADLPITVTGPRNYSVTTNSLGCVLLGFVPVGSYTVSYSRAGYVEDKVRNNQNAQAISQTVAVEGEQTTSVEGVYDQAGSIGVTYKTRVPLATSDVGTTGDGFTLSNSGLGFPNIRTFGPFTAAATQSSGATKSLFPFATNAYTPWAGKCAENNPVLPANGGQLTNANAGVSLTAGAAVTGAVVHEPMIKVTVNKYTNSAQTTTAAVTTAAKVVARPLITGCTADYNQSTANNGTIADNLQPTLPYGDYTLCAQDRTTSPTRRAVLTISNNVRNGKSQTLTLPFGTTNPAAC